MIRIGTIKIGSKTIGFKCADSWETNSQGNGTCSYHKGYGAVLNLIAKGKKKQVKKLSVSQIEKQKRSIEAETIRLNELKKYKQIQGRSFSPKNQNLIQTLEGKIKIRKSLIK